MWTEYEQARQRHVERCRRAADRRRAGRLGADRASRVDTDEGPSGRPDPSPTGVLGRARHVLTTATWSA